MYSREEIHESISVHSFFNHKTRTSGPVVLYWRGHSYRIVKIGVHHTIWEGRVLIHIFSVTDGSTYFKLKYDTETLAWKLEEVGTE
jgi:hypothetical protein